MSAIPDLHFRPTRGEADTDALLAIQTARLAHDGVDPLSTLEGAYTREGMRAHLAEVIAGGQQDRFLVAEAGGGVIGYGYISDWVEADGMRVYLQIGWVLPEWRDRGVGTELLQRLEGRIRELAAAGSGPWEYAGNANSTETQATQLVLDNGYRPAYTLLEMGLDWDAFDAALSRTQWPAGFQRRRATADHVAAIAHSVDEAYRHEYTGDRFSEQLDVAAYTAELTQPPYDLALMQVAWHGDTVAGQVIPVIEKGRAEIAEVSVRPAYRRRGLARALLTEAVRDLRARGVAVVRLHTVAEFQTRAQDMYAAVGFRVLKEFPRYRKPGSAI